MKVLMFGWEFPPYNTGGLGTHCYGLTKALKGLGMDITFVMPKTGADINPGFVKVIQAQRSKTIQIGSSLVPYVPSSDTVNVPAGGKGGALYGRDFFNRVREFTALAVHSVRNERCDLIHCHDWMTFMAGMAVKKEKNKPLIVTVHSTEHDRSPLAPNDWIMHIEWQGMYEADKVITVSHYMKNKIMERYGVPADKIEVVHNAVDANEYHGERISFGLDEKVVLFLGRMTLQKGPDYFLHAARKVLDHEEKVRFVMVGTGNMVPQLIHQSIELGIADKVIFAGYQESIREYYKMADMYVMPSVSEPFGIVALEAMASGTPTIVSKQSGVAEMVSHCFRVDFWDVDEMANKMLGIIRYGSMGHEMRKNGYAEISRINWGNVADKTAQVYSCVRGG